MATRDDHLRGLATAELDRIEQVLRRFEDAWQAGQRPRPADYLAAEPAHRAALLVELAHIDLEYRLKAGEPARVEEYLTACPGTAPGRDAVLALIRAEYELRRVQEPGLGADEYLARFPEYAADLTTLLSSGDAAGTLSTRDRSTATSTGGRRLPAAEAGGLPALPNYEVLEVVGRGGMGVVVKARHLPLNRLVALKLPHPLADAEDRQRFLREARSAARLRHPHVCPIYEVGEHDGRPYLAMAFIRGETLKGWAAQQAPTARRAAEMVAALARAVAYAHTQGVIHRDIKPANVIVDEDTGAPVLTDFGLAKELAGPAAEMTHTGTVMGTPAYMAPEQAAGQVHRVGPAADVYALGVVLYELLTGRLPFLGGLAEVLVQVQTEEPPPPRRLAPQLHRDLETICLKAMAKEPAGRYATAADLADDLERFGAGEAIRARREGLARRLWRKLRRRPITVAAALVGAVLLAVAATLTAAALQAKGSADELNALKKDFDERLAVADRPAEPLARAEALIAELPALDRVVGAIAARNPEEATAARPRPNQRLQELLRKQFHELWRDRVPLDQVPRFDQALAVLTNRDARQGKELARDFRDRLARPQLAFELKGPFRAPASDPPENVFAALPAVAGDALTRPPGGAAGAAVVLTKIPCQGDVQLEARFASPSWEAATELGLWLNALPQPEKGYLLVLRARRPLRVPGDAAPERPGPTPTLGSACAGQGELHLQIFLNGVRLRDAVFSGQGLPGQALTLRAERKGHLLSFKVNQRAPASFLDPLPPSGREAGVFGLHWPAGARLARLTAWQPARPPANPSKLEKGDDLYGRQQFDQARAEYRRLALAEADTRLRQEALYKEALCLLKGQDSGAAVELLEQVAGDPAAGDWGVLARCQLWPLYLGEEKYDKADEVYKLLSAVEFERLALLVPDELRVRIFRSCLPRQGLNPLRVDRSRLNAQELAVKIGDLLHAPDVQQYVARWELFAACDMAGERERALQVAEEAFRKHPKLMWTLINFPARYCWLLRLRDPHRALQFVEKALRDGRVQPERARMLVERARIYAALDRLDEAEQSLDEYFASQPASLELQTYIFYGDAWLLRGVLREVRGDRAGAEKAWRQGLYRNWCRTIGRSPDSLYGLRTAMPRLYASILGSLTGEMTDREANHFVEGGKQVLASGVAAEGLRRLGVEVTPTMVRGLWQNERGRDCARKIALQTIPFSQAIRAPVLLGAVDMMRRKGFAGRTTPEQDEVLWQLADRLAGLATADLLRYGPPLLITANGGGPENRLGWKGLAARLPPALRGPLAYFFGNEYLTRWNRAGDAAAFFRTALADAPPASPLERLARDGLARIGAK